jgi:hypothetical protein
MIRVVEFRDNINLTDNHPSFGTLDVLCTSGLNDKWISVPYELLFDFIFTTDPALKSYSDKFETYELFIDHLYDINYNFNDQVVRYIDSTLNDYIFDELPTYNPDYLAELDL